MVLRRRSEHARGGQGRRFSSSSTDRARRRRDPRWVLRPRGHLIPARRGTAFCSTCGAVRSIPTRAGARPRRRLAAARGNRGGGDDRAAAAPLRGFSRLGSRGRPNRARRISSRDLALWPRPAACGLVSNPRTSNARVARHAGSPRTPPRGELFPGSPGDLAQEALAEACDTSSRAPRPNPPAGCPDRARGLAPAWPRWPHPGRPVPPPARSEIVEVPDDRGLAAHGETDPPTSRVLRCRHQRGK